MIRLSITGASALDEACIRITGQPASERLKDWATDRMWTEICHRVAGLYTQISFCDFETLSGRAVSLDVPAAWFEHF